MATSKAAKLTTAVQIPESQAEELMTEEQLDERAAQKTKRSGRPRNENWLLWEEARQFMHTQQISSRAQYEKWYQREKPKTLPRFPYRVFKEWTTWNDFLGNENKFNEKTGIKWRPLLDAIPFVHSLKIPTMSEWLEYYRLHKESTDFPDDIPARPDLVYSDWRSWGHWLGNKPAEAVQARQEVLRQQIYSIVHYEDEPLNVLHYAIDINATAFRERYEDQGFQIVKTYWYNPQHAERIKQIVDAFSSQYMDQSRQRITPNVYDILWHLDQFLDPVLRGQV